MDAFEQVISDSQLTAAVLGNISTGDFQLIDVDSLPLSVADRAAMTARGMGFVGVLGICDGVPRSALAVDLDPMTTATLAQAFLQHVYGKLQPRTPKGDAVAWLENLYRLQDERTDN